MPGRRPGAVQPGHGGSPAGSEQAASEIAVSVVVCTHLASRYDQLLACLSSLARQTHQPSEVVVVVDGCEKVAAKLGRRSGSEGSGSEGSGSETVVALPVNQGLSAARNIGVSQVSTRWVAFLDDDAVAEPTWLEHLVRVCQEWDTAGAGGWSEPVFPAGTTPRWFPEELFWTVGCSYQGLPTRTSLVRNVFGGCALLRRDLFDLVGGFDVALGRRATGFGGGEEADFCLRASAADPSATFAHVPDSIIRHRVTRERARVRYLLARCYSDGASKGRIARGSRDALGSERAFVASVPTGVLRHLRARRPDAAVVLLLGVAAAAAGYLSTRVVRRPTGPRQVPGQRPAQNTVPNPNPNPAAENTVPSAPTVGDPR